VTDLAPDGTTNADEMSFEKALGRLEEIVQELESGQMPLEEALRCFEEGVRLRAVCMEKLRTAEAKVEHVLAETADVDAPEAESDGQQAAPA